MTNEVSHITAKFGHHSSNIFRVYSFRAIAVNDIVKQTIYSIFMSALCHVFVIAHFSDPQQSSGLRHAWYTGTCTCLQTSCGTLLFRSAYSPAVSTSSTLLHMCSYFLWHIQHLLLHSACLQARICLSSRCRQNQLHSASSNLSISCEPISHVQSTELSCIQWHMGIISSHSHIHPQSQEILSLPNLPSILSSQLQSASSETFTSLHLQTLPSGAAISFAGGGVKIGYIIKQ